MSPAKDGKTKRGASADGGRVAERPGKKPAGNGKATETRTPDGLQTLDRALLVLNLFQPEREEWTAAEAAQELGLSLGLVSRFMRGLAARGFLVRMGSRYRLGFAAIELGQRALESLPLREVLRPIAAQLTREAGETCVVFTLADRDTAARVVDAVEPGGVAITAPIGYRLPLTSGIGKVLLAHMSAEARQALEEPIDDELERVLAWVSEHGYVITGAEFHPDVWGVAAPILTPRGEPVAALALVAPAGRVGWDEEGHLDEKQSGRLVELLLGAVRDGERELGLS